MAQYQHLGLTAAHGDIDTSAAEPAAIEGTTLAAELLDPSTEDAYWRENYGRRPYADDTLGYDQYRPAFRYGWESRARHLGRRWDQVERELERGWREHRGASRLGWNDAKQAARDAWQRVERHLADERDRVNPVA